MQGSVKPVRFAVFKNKLDNQATSYCRKIVNSIRKNIPESQFFAQENPEEICAKNIFSPDIDVDYLIIVGGDGTMSNAVHQLGLKTSPPIFGIGLGNSHVMYNYRCNQLDDLLPAFISKIKNGTVYADRGARLKMSKRIIKTQELLIQNDIAMSEVIVHRGKNQSSLRMEIFINNNLLTTFFGDGMIFSTPLGSLGYSLSSLGPILNGQTSTITMVPICPLSLSFRPICIPDKFQLRIRILQKSRSSGVTSCDSRKQVQLLQGEEVIIQKSEHYVQIVSGLIQPTEHVWIDKLKTVLKWGNQFAV